jgi:acyl carrier protein
VSDSQQRLIRCFEAIFPELSARDIARASASSVAAWDSVATVTLAAIVEEAFGIQLQAEEIEKMDSFQSYLNLLDRR